MPDSARDKPERYGNSPPLIALCVTCSHYWEAEEDGTVPICPADRTEDRNHFVVLYVPEDGVEGVEIPMLSTGEAFKAVREAIVDPASRCEQLTSYPAGCRQMEPVSRWQARAVMAALGKLKAKQDRNAR